MTLTVLVVIVFVKSVMGFEGLDQNPLYRGPTDCDEVLKNHYAKFSEYPTGDNATAQQQNFLNMGDTCDPQAEVDFLQEMQQTFLNGTENSARMRLVAELWERWRAEAENGSMPGRRICNPKRMLECHRSISKCVCRSTLRLFDVKDFQNDDLIQIDSVRVKKEVPLTQAEENVEECRAKVDSICQWNVPWLGFCSIPCDNLDAARPSFCVGQPDGAKRCRVCNPTEDIQSEGKGKCFQAQHPGIDTAQSQHQLVPLVILFHFTGTILLGYVFQN